MHKRLPFIFVILLLAYFLWEVYWLTQVHYLFIKWHTHLMIYVYLCALLLGGVWLTKQRWSKDNYRSAQLLVIVLCTTLIFIESGLILLGKNDTYNEHINYGYVSRYSNLYESYYRLHLPYEVFDIKRPEFIHKRTCNKLGFADRDWSETKTTPKRILCLGDSFTEGVGAQQDSTYVQQLSDLLNADSVTYEVMNAGITGNDPFVNFVAYRDLLLDYKPDIILQTLSSNDLNTDIATKGGLERFKEDKTVAFRSPPWWEPIYALSYVSRLFFSALGYNELLIPAEFSKQESDQLNNSTINMFKQYAMLAKGSDCRLIVVLQPNHHEIYTKKFDYDLQPIANAIINEESIEVYDMLRDYIQFFEGKENIANQYYWPHDGHHNTIGYNLMAKSMQKAINANRIKQ